MSEIRKSRPTVVPIIAEIALAVICTPIAGTVLFLVATVTGAWDITTGIGFLTLLYLSVGVVFAIPAIGDGLPSWLPRLFPISNAVQHYRRERQAFAVNDLIEGAFGNKAQAKTLLGAYGKPIWKFKLFAPSYSFSQIEAHLEALKTSAGYGSATLERIPDRGGLLSPVVELRLTAPPSALTDTHHYPSPTPERSSAEFALVGWDQKGAPWYQPILGQQTLVVGCSGSGKGSIIWSLVSGMSRDIAAGNVRLWGIDLKGGVELAAAKQLFDQLAYDHSEAIALLRDLTNVLDWRLKELRESGSRKHQPTPVSPAYVLIIDEAASLVYDAPDSRAAKEADQLLKRILSTGRAAGIAVIAALQDPRKEALASRDLFTTQIGLRMRTKADTLLALGAAAWDEGAQLETISPQQPGTAFVVMPGSWDPVRKVRAYWVSDARLRQLPEGPLPPPIN